MSARYAALGRAIAEAEVAAADALAADDTPAPSWAELLRPGVAAMMRAYEPMALEIGDRAALEIWAAAERARISGGDRGGE